jgi:hypothetical protein
VIDLADEVPIQEIFTEMGIHCPSGVVGSWKMPCPWGSEHKDGGVEPDFRVYASNSAHCFAMHGSFRPSSLLARWRGWSRRRAAEHILERRGLDRPRSYRERWARVIIDRDIRTTPAGDPQQVVEVVQARMADDPAYHVSEFSDHVLETWRELLGALDGILRVVPVDVEAITAWIEDACSRLHDSALTAVQQVGTLDSGGHGT